MKWIACAHHPRARRHATPGAASSSARDGDWSAARAVPQRAAAHAARRLSRARVKNAWRPAPVAVSVHRVAVPIANVPRVRVHAARGHPASALIGSDLRGVARVAKAHRVSGSIAHVPRVPARVARARRVAGETASAPRPAGRAASIRVATKACTSLARSAPHTILAHPRAARNARWIAFPAGLRRGRPHAPAGRGVAMQTPYAATRGPSPTVARDRAPRRARPRAAHRLAPQPVRHAGCRAAHRAVPPAARLVVLRVVPQPVHRVECRAAHRAVRPAVRLVVLRAVLRPARLAAPRAVRRACPLAAPRAARPPGRHVHSPAPHRAVRTTVREAVRSGLRRAGHRVAHPQARPVAARVDPHRAPPAVRRAGPSGGRRVSVVRWGRSPVLAPRRAVRRDPDVLRVHLAAARGTSTATQRSALWRCVVKGYGAECSPTDGHSRSEPSPVSARNTLCAVSG